MASLHDFQVKSLDGTPKKLDAYAGKVLLVVNVASRCGLTPQYTALEALYREYEGKGLRILGFPANEFGAQEPGTNDEIKTFCSTKYDVTFDMFAKLKVKGDGIDPLFAWLTAEKGGEIKWNFNKFLVGKKGEVLARFEPTVEPSSPEVKSAIEKALAG